LVGAHRLNRGVAWTKGAGQHVVKSSVPRGQKCQSFHDFDESFYIKIYWQFEIVDQNQKWMIF
jgi:hypothetical protein